MAIAREVASVTRLGIEVGCNYTSVYSVTIVYIIAYNKVIFFFLIDIVVISLFYLCSGFSIYAKGLYVKICHWSYSGVHL